MLPQAIADTLIENPLLLLFLVTAIGYPLGRIKVMGSSLGVAAVLFVGLAVGALHPDFELPEVIFLLGLTIFVYTIGLSSGAGFFASFRRKGLRDNLFVVAMLLLAAVLTAGAYTLLSLSPAVAAGIYAGSLTNSPALAGLLDLIQGTAPANELDFLLAQPVIGYSVTYPMGVLGMILVVSVMQRLWKIDYRQDAARVRDIHAVDQPLYNRTVIIREGPATALPLSQLIEEHRWSIIFTRMQRGEQTSLLTGDSRLQKGDLVNIIGTPEAVDEAIPVLGDVTDIRLEFDRSQFDFRRIFVSNHEVVGKRLSALNLPSTYDALVTRVRRGDIDVLASGATQLELGDRVRVVAPRDRMQAVSKFFGDSYRELSEVNLLSLGLGLSAGLLLGLLPLPLPGGVTFRLGFAGGPLIVGLILGALRRTGPIVWTLPYSANLTLRQVGLILLLAAIGVRSGYIFASTFVQSGGLYIFLAGTVITLVTGLTTLWIGYKVFKIPYGLLIGMLAGLQTQPAVLGYSLEQAENDLPNIGYALVYPVTTIVKILAAQLLLILLQ